MNASKSAALIMPTQDIRHLYSQQTGVLDRVLGLLGLLQLLLCIMWIMSMRAATHRCSRTA